MVRMENKDGMKRTVEINIPFKEIIDGEVWYNTSYNEACDNWLLAGRLRKRGTKEDLDKLKEMENTRMFRALILK